MQQSKIPTGSDELVFRPQLLAHPHIPKPLHGLAPRTILGTEWWDRVRRIAYAHMNYHCWACGVAKEHALFHQWLEAHEAYTIDYQKGSVELDEIVALCHACHNFIHSGRLFILYEDGEISPFKAKMIMKRGIRICDQNNVTPSWMSLAVDAMLRGIHYEYAIQLPDVYELIEAQRQPNMAPWEDWHLVLGGEKHYSPYKNELEWAKHFR